MSETDAAVPVTQTLPTAIDWHLRTITHREIALQMALTRYASGLTRMPETAAPVIAEAEQYFRYMMTGEVPDDADKTTCK